MTAGTLAAWHDFFLLVGGAAATLLGLIFVAASIAASIPNDKLGSRETRLLWVGPIIYAFLRVLILAALGVLPGQTGTSFGLLAAGLAIFDVVRMVLVTRGLLAHHQRTQDLDAEDWRWYSVYPFASTGLVLASGVALVCGYEPGMYGVAAGALDHLVIGVHNAWEVADWLATAQ